MSAAQKNTLTYFKWAFIVTIVGLILGGYLGWEMTGTVGGTATIAFVDRNPFGNGAVCQTGAVAA